MAITQQQKQELEQKIKTRIEQIQSLLDGTQAPYDNDSGAADDKAAQLDETIHAEVDQQIIASAKNELELLNQNLAWLDSEDAGYCETCDETIPVKRLQAVPTTKHCVQCAEKH